MKKENLSDLFYSFLVREILDRAYRAEYANAWVVTWHLKMETGFPTSQLNYHLNKLVKSGKVLKRTSVYCTEFRPADLEGFTFKDDKFYHKTT